MFVLETTGKGVALKKRNEITLVSRVLVVIVNVVLSYVLIQIWGLKGVACAGAIAGLLLYATDTYFGQRYYTTIPNLLHSVIGIVAII